MTTASKRKPKGIRLGPEDVPQFTLGWQILGWTREFLLQPDGPNAGEPWVYTDEQARFILNWYAVDESGRFTYRYGMFRRMKGHGKDPLGASLCCIEFVGPCRFGGWDGKEPIAVPQSSAWIQTAAVSREQTRNTMTLFPGMLSPRAQSEFSIDLGKEIIYADHGQKRIEAVTSSPRALEGGRASFVLKNETHHWLHANEGLAMSQVIARNAAKSRGGSSRVLAISNAHEPGENSDAEHDWEAYQKGVQGLSRATDMLYDSLEAPAGVDLDDDEAVREAVMIARGDSDWIDPDRLVAEIRDPRTTPATARRFYFNQLEAEEDKPFDADRFAALAKPGTKIAHWADVTVGFDGSRRRDFTDIVVTDIRTGHQVLYGHFEPMITEELDGDLWIPATQVDELVREIFARFKVWAMYADPPYWDSEIAVWEGLYGDKVVRVPTNNYRRMAAGLATYRSAIEIGDLTNDGDPRFVGAIRNARKRQHSFRDEHDVPMWTIQKERQDSPLKIDAAMAGCLSWMARTDAIAAGMGKPSGPVLPITDTQHPERKPEFAGVQRTEF